MNINVIKKIFPQINCNNINKLKYDQEGLWSISRPVDADEISTKIKLFEKTGITINTILDSTAGLGGNTLSFANYFNKVISVEYDKERFELLKNNIDNYTYNNIVLHNFDFLQILKEINEQIDVVFVDPPWGGPNYKFDDNLNIKISNTSLSDICILLDNYSFNDNKIKIIIFKLPYNFNYNEMIDNCKSIVKLHQIIKEGNIIYLLIHLDKNK